MIPLRYRPAAVEQPGSAGRGFELAAFVWAMVVGVAVHVFLSDWLILVYRYGWAKVRRDRLTIVKIDWLRERWTVSNGDEFMVWEYKRELLELAVLVPILVVTLPILWLVFRRVRGKATG